jgi:hypothetical protein
VEKRPRLSRNPKHSSSVHSFLDVNDQKQARNELIELLQEIVDALGSRKSVQLTDEDVRRYEARAARIQQLSDKTCDPQLR